MIKELQKQQQVIHDSVNECLTQKVAQTVTLAVSIIFTNDTVRILLFF